MDFNGFSGNLNASLDIAMCLHYTVGVGSDEVLSEMVGKSWPPVMVMWLSKADISNMSNGYLL